MNRPNGHQVDALTRLVEEAQDWSSYAEHHPTHSHTDAWARALVRDLLDILEES
jgi:hypothetical protein